MAKRPRKKIRKSLGKKGFAMEQSRRHEKWRFVPHGIATPYYVLISRSPQYRDYGPELLSDISKDQLEITTEQLLGLIDCPIEQENLEDIYISRGAFAPSQVLTLIKARKS